MATLAVASAGYIEPATHLSYSSPVVGKVAYSDAPSVSHVYSSISAPTELHYGAPVQKVAYAAAPVLQKTVQLSSPIVQKSYDYPSSGLSTYYSPAAVQKTVYSAPSHTLAYTAPVAKTISYAAPSVYDAHNPPTYQHTHESVERSHDGTVSHYGKTLSTPHSHVQKVDTRVTNDQYKYAAVPVVQKFAAAPVQYTQYSHASPVQYSTPVQYQQYSHSAPVYQQQYAAVPAVQHYSHAAPIVSQYAHATPVVSQYAHSAPVLAQKTISYSPADVVAHTTFESNNAHYAW